MNVGIDWADAHHDVEFMDDDGTVIDAFRIDHNAEGFSSLSERINACCAAPPQVHIAIETCHGLLVHDLYQRRYIVYAINPKAADRYKDRHRASGSKNDKLDAHSLADLIRVDRSKHRPLQLMPDDYRLLDAYCSDQLKLIGESSRLTNQLLDCLKTFHPSAIGLFTDLNSNIYSAFLRKYPTPEALASVSETDFIKFMKDQGYSQPKRIGAIYEATRRPIPKIDNVCITAGRLRMLTLLDQLDATRARLKEYDKTIQELLESLPEHDIVSGLPGLGAKLAPQVVAALGPNMVDVPKRFESAKQLATLSGSVPVTRQTGKTRAIVKIRRACNKPLRRLFYLWAEKSLPHSEWAKAFYQYQVKQKQSRNTIIRCLAVKWIKIVFHLWKNGLEYDEQRHIANLKKNNVAWAMGL